MAFSNYYVGTDLNNIGAQMQQDRGMQAQAQMAQAEQKRLAYAQFMQQLQQQQAQAQQERQFQQELAFRQSGQGQENSYREALLGLRRSDSNRDDTYRYAALDNALKQIQAQAQIQDPRLAVAETNQKAITARDTAIAIENWETETAAAKAKAARWNQRFKLLDDQIKQEQEDKGSEWLTSKGGAEKWAKGEKAKRYSALSAELQQLDKSTGDVIPDETGTRWIPLLKPRPYAGATQPYNPLTDVGPNGQPPVGTLSGLNVSTQIKFRDSNGGFFDAPANQWENIKRADPGAVLVTPNRPNPRTGGAAGGWQPAPQPKRNGLWNALYGNATDFYGGAYNQAIYSAGTALQPAVSSVNNYYQQLIDILSGDGSGMVHRAATLVIRDGPPSGYIDGPATQRGPLIQDGPAYPPMPEPPSRNPLMARHPLYGRVTIDTNNIYNPRQYASNSLSQPDYAQENADMLNRLPPDTENIESFVASVLSEYPSIRRGPDGRFFVLR